MLSHLNPKERATYALVTAFLVAFIAYVGGQNYGHKSEPLVIKEATPPRTQPAAVPLEKTTKDRTELMVHVVGAVRKPGVYKLANGKRIFDAISAAGGPARADEEKLNLAAKLTDGEQIKVPRMGDPASAMAPAMEPLTVGQIEPLGSRSTRSKRGGKSPTSPVDLNSATSEELQTVPGIGPSTAEKILDYRKQHGSFTSVDEITSVGGVGQKKLEKMRPWLHV